MIIEFLVAQTVRAADAIIQASFTYHLLFRSFCLLTIVDRSRPTYKLQQKLLKIKLQDIYSSKLILMIIWVLKQNKA